MSPPTSTSRISPGVTEGAEADEEAPGCPEEHDLVCTSGDGAKDAAQRQEMCRK